MPIIRIPKKKVGWPSDPPGTRRKKNLQGGDIRAIKVIKKPSNSEGLQTVSNEAGGEVDDL